LTRTAYVAGTGLTRFGERRELGPEQLAAEASLEALGDAGLEVADVEAAWVGAFYPATGLGGSFLVDAIGCRGIAVTHVENLCASGMDAFRHAVLAVEAGVCDIALAVGVDKLTDHTGRGLPPEPALPAMAKMVDANHFALMASRAFSTHGWTREDLAAVAVKNAANGSAHPKARLRAPVTTQQVLDAPEVSSPLGVQDCCPVADGAGAVVVASEEVARRTTHCDVPVRVRAVEAAASVSHPFFELESGLDGFEVTRRAARQAYHRAGITRPAEQLDLVEAHDCFTITELLDIGDLGLCAPADAAAFVRDGRADVDGLVPVNPSGGLKAFGHPIGATGVRMIHEVTRQLQGRAEGRQVRGAGVGLAQNLGGLGGVCLVSVLARAD
jgi:acetyl-CoA C-acetyltransferase